jgi:lipoate-protein ligase A
VNGYKTIIQLLAAQAGEPAWNMALDEALLEEAAAGRAAPCARFYTWSPAAVTIGYSQDAAVETDAAACRAAGAPVIRRITGGGAVFHENEITYSMVIPAAAAPGTVEASYRLICGAIAAGLDFLKNGFEFSPVNDIIYRGKKVSGSAQVRRGGMLLQHGTILLNPDKDRMFGLLRAPESKFKKHGHAGASERVGGLEEAAGRAVSAEEAAEAALKGLRGVFEITPEPAEILPDILEAARRLLPRYLSDDWNLRRKKPAPGDIIHSAAQGGCTDR